MAIRNVSLGGASNWTSEVLTSTDLNDTFNAVSSSTSILYSSISSITSTLALNPKYFNYTASNDTLNPTYLDGTIKKIEMSANTKTNPPFLVKGVKPPVYSFTGSASGNLAALTFDGTRLIASNGTSQILYFVGTSTSIAFTNAKTDISALTFISPNLIGAENSGRIHVFNGTSTSILTSYAVSSSSFRKIWSDGTNLYHQNSSTFSKHVGYTETIESTSSGYDSTNNKTMKDGDMYIIDGSTIVMTNHTSNSVIFQVNSATTIVLAGITFTDQHLILARSGLVFYYYSLPEVQNNTGISLGLNNVNFSTSAYSYYYVESISSRGDTVSLSQWIMRAYV
jgi:hypothetical protein